MMADYHEVTSKFLKDFQAEKAGVSKKQAMAKRIEVLKGRLAK